MLTIEISAWLGAFLETQPFYMGMMYVGLSVPTAASTLLVRLAGRIEAMSHLPSRQDHLDSFLQHLQVSKSRPRNTLTNARSVTKNFIAYAQAQGVRNAEHTTTETVIAFLDQIPHPSTRRAARYYLSLFFDHIGLQPNPVHAVKAPRINPTEGLKHLEPEELVLLLSLLEHYAACGIHLRDYALVLLMLYTGMRPNEALSLKKEDVLASGRVYIRKSKTDVSRTCQVPPCVLDALQAYHTAFPHPDNPYVFYAHHQPTLGHLSYTSVRTAFKALLKEVGIEREHLNLHALRHTFACCLKEGDIPEEYIQKLMGHQSIRITRIYTRFSDQDVLRKFH